MKYGLLIRGGKLSAADRAVLVGEMGIQHDLDLRGREGGGSGTETELLLRMLGLDEQQKVHRIKAADFHAFFDSMRQMSLPQLIQVYKLPER